jgi:transcriptional regulator with XRE-family HTH domain
MPDFAANLRRLMARQGLTLDEVVQRSGLDERTIKGILSGTKIKPHARTLHQLATGLQVSADELFLNPSSLAHRVFDRQTNPLIDELVDAQPALFDGWSWADFDELYSHFGLGGGLTHAGAVEMVHSINRKRQIYSKVAILLESSDAELFSGIVDLLYDRVVVKS